MAEHPFIEGEQYCNRFGDYIVRGISGDDMTVAYINGEKSGGQQTLSASGQVRVHRNIVRARRKERLDSGPADALPRKSK